MMLDFGGGEKIKDYPYKIVDLCESADYIHDLNKFPYPFKDNSVKEIICSHTLEHLNNPDKVLKEFHRILEPNGYLNLRVPHFSSCGAVKGNPEHKHLFSMSFIDFYDKLFKLELERLYWMIPKSRWDYSEEKYSVKRNWIKEEFGGLINNIISVKPRFFERFIRLYIGGFNEIEWRVKVK